MSAVRATRRRRLESLRDYLTTRIKLAQHDGNSARGLKTWVRDLDAVLKTHAPKERA